MIIRIFFIWLVGFIIAMITSDFKSESYLAKAILWLPVLIVTICKSFVVMAEEFNESNATESNKEKKK